MLGPRWVLRAVEQLTNDAWPEDNSRNGGNGDDWWHCEGSMPAALYMSCLATKEVLLPSLGFSRM